MEKKVIPQEGLKLLACVTMLIDHIGAAFVPGIGLRIIGRLAFPIYCFLLAEGVRYTRSLKSYGIRLCIGALLSELPFDLLFFGSVTARHQSVMVTLLLGYLALLWARKMKNHLLPAIVCFAAAELLSTDYGGWGVAMIVLFDITAGKSHERILQILGLTVICWCIGGLTIAVGAVRMPVEMFAVLAMIPIGLYSGRKVTRSRAVQRAFYLFYPAHLTVLLLIAMM